MVSETLGALRSLLWTVHSLFSGKPDMVEENLSIAIASLRVAAQAGKQGTNSKMHTTKETNEQRGSKFANALLKNSGFKVDFIFSPNQSMWIL